MYVALVNCLIIVILVPQATALREEIMKSDNESQIRGMDYNCPTWHAFNNETKECTCQNFKEVIKCDEMATVSLEYGYCMTFDNETKETQVGKCSYTLFERLNGSQYTTLPLNPSDLNQFMCSQWHREGYLCSTCEKGYGLSLANFYMNCVKCTLTEGVGWLLFFILQVMPVTIIFIVIITFRISIARPPMNAFVVHSQVCLALIYLNAARFQTPYLSSSVSQTFVTTRNIFLPILGIWNLGFVSHIEKLTSFCVTVHLNHQQFYFLTYTTNIHVLLLIVTTFVFIELHARNCRVIVWLWRPFYKCFVRCTRVWNPRLTTIDTFATFLLLSYSRLIILSYFIYAFQHVYTLDKTLSSRIVLLYNPTMRYFDHNHLPYALVNFLMLLVLVLMPAFILALYQTKTFQKCLKCLNLHRCLSLRMFIEVFQGCYKDGTDGTYDLRFTASLYLFLRLGLLLALSLIHI